VPSRIEIRSGLLREDSGKNLQTTPPAHPYWKGAGRCF
jgi:hypothetical protein